MEDSPALYDAVVIGAGPAGLTAALYLARYRRKVLALHDGRSRALRVPKTHNAPGFPEGIRGVDLIERMTGHALQFNAEIAQTEVTDIEHTSDGFRLHGEDGRSWESRSVILATGILLNQVKLPHETHEQAIEAGVLRYCPICDGYEHSNARIAVLGCDSDGAAEALFLRQYSADITLLPLSHPDLSAEQKRELRSAGIKVDTGALQKLVPHDDHMEVRLEDHSEPLRFDVVYPALGCQPRAELAVRLGITLKEDGSVPAAAVSATDVPGFFGAGDVLEGLDQISVAMGHGALAATNAHNWLRERDNHTLQAKD